MHAVSKQNIYHAIINIKFGIPMEMLTTNVPLDIIRNPSRCGENHIATEGKYLYPLYVHLPGPGLVSMSPASNNNKGMITRQ